MRELILEVKNLSVDFKLKSGNLLRACDDVSLNFYKGEMVGIIGESGSGKSTFASGILNIIQSPGKISSGEVFYYFDNQKIDLLKLNKNEYNTFRWNNIASVFQAAQNALNPILKIKEHFIETALAHDKKITALDILDKATQILKKVRLEARILESYPHELSGGMKQRVIIAISLLLEPDIIILDEPTTALDVITQWHILDILKSIQTEQNLTMIFLTHDVSVVGAMVDRLGVMYAGQMVEHGNIYSVFKNPTHPYTKGLINAIPSIYDDISKRKAIAGHSINLIDMPPICRFSPRCYICLNKECEGDKEKTDILYESDREHYTRCYNWQKVENEFNKY